MKNMISKKIKFKIFILIMFVVFIIGAVSVLAAEVSYSQNYPWQRAEGISGIKILYHGFGNGRRRRFGGFNLRRDFMDGFRGGFFQTGRDGMD